MTIVLLVLSIVVGELLADTLTSISPFVVQSTVYGSAIVIAVNICIAIAKRHYDIIGSQIPFVLSTIGLAIANAHGNSYGYRVFAIGLVFVTLVNVGVMVYNGRN